MPPSQLWERGSTVANLSNAGMVQFCMVVSDSAPGRRRSSSPVQMSESPSPDRRRGSSMSPVGMLIFGSLPRWQVTPPPVLGHFMGVARMPHVPLLRSSVAGSPQASEVESLPAAVASKFQIDANHTHADHAIKGHADDIGHSFSWAHLVLRFKSLWGLSTETRVDLTLARPPTDLSVTPGNSTPMSITIQSKHMKYYYSIKAHKALLFNQST
jgi:hypothetical protein